MPEGRSEHEGEITRLLHRASSGEAGVLPQVLGLLHERLRRIARHQLRGEQTGHTLETDGLVHEAFLRMNGMDKIQWRDRQHLLAMAARTMRRVLIDHAGKRRSGKRGGGAANLPLDQADHMLMNVDRHAEDLHSLDEALQRFATIDPRQALIVEYRFFVGLSIEETAALLGLSTATVKRDWTAARAWLNRELSA